VWIYAVVDRRGDVGSVAELVAVFCFHALIGAVAGRWWAILLPLLLLPLALPAGSAPHAGDVDRVWEIVLLITYIWIAAVAVGVFVRKAATARLGRQAC
jgi:hypothetical protein